MKVRASATLRYEGRPWLPIGSKVFQDVFAEVAECRDLSDFEPPASGVMSASASPTPKAGVDGSRSGVAAPQWCCHAARTWSHRDGDHDCRHRPGEECLPGARYRRSRRSPRPTSAKA